MVPAHYLAICQNINIRRGSASRNISGAVLASIKLWSSLFRRGHPRRQFHDLDVAKVDLRSFRFEAEVALLLRRAADAIHELAVHRHLDDALAADRGIGVPFAPPLAADFDALAPLAP